MSENKKGYKIVEDNLGEYSILRADDTIVSTEIQDIIFAESVLDELNALHEENQQLRLELNTHKHPLWSTREAERKVNELTNLLANETKKNAILLEEINSLRIENMRLKELK